MDKNQEVDPMFIPQEIVEHVVNSTSAAARAVDLADICVSSGCQNKEDFVALCGNAWDALMKWRASNPCTCPGCEED